MQLFDCTLRDGGNVLGNGFPADLTVMMIDGLIRNLSACRDAVNRVPSPASSRLTRLSRSSKGACSSRANTAGFVCPARISSTP